MNKLTQNPWNFVHKACGKFPLAQCYKCSFHRFVDTIFSYLLRLCVVLSSCKCKHQIIIVLVLGMIPCFEHYIVFCSPNETFHLARPKFPSLRPIQHWDVAKCQNKTLLVMPNENLKIYFLFTDICE